MPFIKIPVWPMLILFMLCVAMHELLITASYAESIHLSEIGMFPTDEDPCRYVELFNDSDKAISLAGLTLRDAGGNSYSIPDKVKELPSKGILLLVFPAKETDLKDDLSFEGDNSARLVCEVERAKKFFTGDVDECALSQANASNGEKIIDYVCWGKNIHTERLKYIKSAVDAGLWRTAEGIILSSPPDEPVDGGKTARPGSSFARMFFDKVNFPEHEQWYICYSSEIPEGKRWVPVPDETSFGKINPLLPPNPFQPFNGSIFSIRGYDKVTILFDCFQRLKTPPMYRLQVATDAEFTALLVDGLLVSDREYIKLNPGKYYWRVRTEIPKTGAASAWSAVQEFTYGGIVNLDPSSKTVETNNGTSEPPSVSAASGDHVSHPPDATSHNTGRPTASSTDAAPTATGGAQEPPKGGAEGPVAEASPFPWAIVIIVAIAALSVGAITTLLLTRAKRK